ncbi:TrlF family AAA-like ATPase [Plantibacter sp. CFBP 8775]|uniref:TrlF family AAA-like ATPase n=1 Tax=Plantibacter sp. CFBP 8775 TaxID=2774038 RepID=UPI001784E18C|nr:AAA family ATPase [Plantibacter sp. CFBP 8775]MBD8103979.1 AAA family ATPase [Plantibacter sp. CFBP 8775]
MASLGAQWIRAALQVNPFSYQGRSSPSDYFETEDAYNTALIDECEVLGITVIAVTDHWRVDSAKSLIAAGEARGLVVLPGFEANSSEGIHILVLFEAGTPFDAINASIGGCGARPGCDNGTVGHSFADIMDKMTADGALPIPAHVNTNPAGLLTTRSGQPLATMIRNDNLHAIGVSPGADETRDQQAVIDGTGMFERVHPLAILHADDVMGPRQLRTPGASSWFKVSSPSLESLKLAVRTPQTRVSLEDPVAVPRARITGVSWVGGYLDGVTVPVSSDLTTLIGGRGAGKSTVIESIRYALGIKPLSRQMAKDHQSMVDHVLNAGTIVRVEVESVSPTVQSFTIEREVPHLPVVLDASGQRTKLTPTFAIGAVEVFGQHELAELASDSQSIAQLVRRFDGSEVQDAELPDLRARLQENREDLQRAEKLASTLEADLDRADQLEEQVGHYEQTDVPAKLAGQQRLAEDEAVFVEGHKRLAAAQASHDTYIKSSAVAELTAAVDNIDGTPQSDKLKRVSGALTKLSKTLSDLQKGADAAFTAAQAEVTAAKVEWEESTREEKASYGEVLRDLTERGLDPGRFVATKSELATLKASKPRLRTQKAEIKRLAAERDSLLGELRAYETRSTEHLHRSVRAANDATGGVVVVSPTPSSDRDHILDLIKEHVSGQRTQITAAIQAAGFSPRVLANAIRSGTTELSKLDIKGAQANNLATAGEPLARELEELSVGLAVEVRLKVDETAGLRTMDQLSKGQRATALLLLLLGASDAPLIIDQPEDDLDNNFVYKGVVKHLRALKGKRQVIASTHNANVPVLGDAELIVVLESDGAHGKPAEDGIGSLDDRSIRDLAENILEGGPAAFNARHHLYGF